MTPRSDLASGGFQERFRISQGRSWALGTTVPPPQRVGDAANEGTDMDPTQLRLRIATALTAVVATLAYLDTVAWLARPASAAQTAQAHVAVVTIARPRP